MSMVDIMGLQEIVGDMLVAGDDDADDILGYDDDDDVGAAPRRRAPAARRKAAARARATAVAARQVQGGAIVREHAYTKARQWILGLDSVATVAGGATVNITTNPQMPYRPRRLSVLGSVAASFLLNNLVIGNQPQFASLAFAVPADMFGPTAFGTDLQCDTAQPNTNVQVQVTNISGGALRFVAGIIGDAVA